MATEGSRWGSLWHKVTKRIALVTYVVLAVPWLSAIRLRRRGAKLVLWIPHRYPSSLLAYVGREDTIVKDAGLLAALCERKIPFDVVLGRGIEKVRGRDVVYTIHPYNPDGLHDYAEGLLVALRRIEANGNRLFPSADEAEWWENKGFMHRRFAELDVHCPPTVIVDLSAPLDPSAFEYPILVKEPHASGSRGLHKVASPGELQRVVGEMKRDGETELLVQDLIDMRRDFRATLVGDRIVHSYFRINTSADWKPTSTSHGSIVDFEHFPEQWRAYIVEVFGRLGLQSGAFDLCWAGDDLETEPYVLEVSPSYTPNPPPPAGWTRPYVDFKSVLFGRDSYAKASVATVFWVAGQLIDEYGLGA